MSNIKKLRADLGLSQVEFAKMLGTSQATVSAWETGKCPSYIDKLAEISYMNERNCDRCGGEVGASSTICFNYGEIEDYEMSDFKNLNKFISSVHKEKTKKGHEAYGLAIKEGYTHEDAMYIGFTFANTDIHISDFSEYINKKEVIDIYKNNELL